MIINNLLVTYSRLHIHRVNNMQSSQLNNIYIYIKTGRIKKKTLRSVITRSFSHTPNKRCGFDKVEVVCGKRLLSKGLCLPHFHCSHFPYDLTAIYKCCFVFQQLFYTCLPTVGCRHLPGTTREMQPFVF